MHVYAFGIQWNPYITDTIGEQAFGHYGGVALLEGFQLKTLDIITVIITNTLNTIMYIHVKNSSIVVCLDDLSFSSQCKLTTVSI